MSKVNPNMPSLPVVLETVKCGKHCFTQDATVALIWHKIMCVYDVIRPLSPVLMSTADGHIDHFGHLSIPNANH